MQTDVTKMMSLLKDKLFPWPQFRLGPCSEGRGAFNHFHLILLIGTKLPALSAFLKEKKNTCSLNPSFSLSDTHNRQENWVKLVGRVGFAGFKSLCCPSVTWSDLWLHVYTFHFLQTGENLWSSLHLFVLFGCYPACGMRSARFLAVHCTSTLIPLF